MEGLYLLSYSRQGDKATKTQGYWGCKERRKLIKLNNIVHGTIEIEGSLSVMALLGPEIKAQREELS